MSDTLRTLAEQCRTLADRLDQADAERIAPPRVATSVTLRTREYEVLIGCAKDMSNAELGVRLHLAEDTVKRHVTHMLEALGARTRAHAVALAYQNGLLEGTSIRPYERGEAA